MFPPSRDAARWAPPRAWQSRSASEKSINVSLQGFSEPAMVDALERLRGFEVLQRFLAETNRKCFP